jgi:hypothetical protein
LESKGRRIKSSRPAWATEQVLLKNKTKQSRMHRIWLWNEIKMREEFELIHILGLDDWTGPLVKKSSEEEYM